MACINPDGTITESAKAMLRAIENPLSPEEISSRLGQPLFKVRSSLREMEGAGFVMAEGSTYRVTDRGKEKL